MDLILGDPVEKMDLQLANESFFVGEEFEQQVDCFFVVVGLLLEDFV